VGELMETVNGQGWLTTTQVATLLGVPLTYVRELTHRKGTRPPLLRSYKIGHALLIRREDAEAYRATHPRLGKTIARRKAASLSAAS